MPKATTTSKTLARLAMGTALVTVMAGCENRTATAVSDLINLPPTAPVAAPVPTAPAPAQAYIAPGAPTYREATRAANIQTFESVYGQPIASVAAGDAVTEAPYTPPSYDDGTVSISSLPAPSPETVTYAAPVEVAPYTVTTDAAPYAVATEVTEGLVYGETLTSSAYSVVADPLPVAPMVESYTVEPLPAPVESVTMAPVSSFQVIPLTEAAAPVVEPMPLEAMPISDTGLSYGVDVIANDEALATYQVTPGDQSALQPLEYGAPLGFEVSTLDTMPSDVVTFETLPIETIIAEVMPLETYAPMPSAVAIVETSPIPTPRPMVEAMPAKAPIIAAAVRTDEASPLLAPVPRPRPALAEPAFASFMAPLPQPRPDYRAPVAMATTAGKYLPVGSIADWEKGGEVPAASASTEMPETPVVETASLTPQDPVLDLKEMPVKLSGTSWRLVALGDIPVMASAELHFDDSSAFAGGQGPCNSYGGEFVNEGAGIFSMANIFATKMACPELDLEQDYIEALKMADRYEIAADFSAMELRDESGKTVARFSAF